MKPETAARARVGLVGFILSTFIMVVLEEIGLIFFDIAWWMAGMIGVFCGVVLRPAISMWIARGPRHG